jgi:hypothetical protein
MASFFDTETGCNVVFPIMSLLDLSINKLRRISNLIAFGMPKLRVLNLAYNMVSDLSPLFSKSANL